MNEIPKIDPHDFIKSRLLTPKARLRFLEMERPIQLRKIKSHALGDDLGRYAPEPVYSKTGKGKLESKGVEGLLRDQAILDYYDNEGRKSLEAVHQKVLDLLRDPNSFF